MKYKDNIQQAYHALFIQKTRTILTVLALSIGIASVVIIISAGKGLEHLIVGELDIYSSDTINIEVRVPGKGNTGSMTSMASGVTITTLKNSDMEKIGALANIQYPYNYIVSQNIIKYRGNNKTVTVLGYGAFAPYVEKIDMYEGRFYSPQEEDALSRVVVLGIDVKKELFGEDSAIGKHVFIKGKSFKVLGVQAERGASFGFDYDSLVYIPTKTLQKRLLGTDYAMGINARVIDIEKIHETVQDIEIVLREQHGITDAGKDDFKVTTMDEMRETLDTVIGAITLLLIALVCISLLVGGVGITNIMYVTVAERTFEIGLRKAVGATRVDILWQFLIESMMLTGAGGIVGVIGGVIVSGVIYYVAMSYGLNWVFSVPLYSIILAIGFSTGVGLFFGIYPAKKASDLNPIIALKKE